MKIELKEGQKVIGLDGKTYLIEKGDCMQEGGIDPIVQKIADHIESSGDSLVGLRPYLETLFPKKSIDFSFSGAPHFTIKTKQGTIVIVNKKYADDEDIIVGELAIGLN